MYNLEKKNLPNRIKMLQVLQHQKTGEIIVDELPPPQCFPNGILVETHYSLISAGTEKTSIENAQVSLIERARRQPDQVKLVLDFIKKEGLFSTLERVKAKLDSYKVLGYSASGVVIESDCPEFAPGDRVAIAGSGYANHSEICAVPKNLAVKLPENVDLADAAFTTVAAIALQGVRQANPKIGENVAVIGLGLIGQITVQLLKASGCNIIGFDIDETTFANAKDFGCEAVFPSSSEFVKTAIAHTNSMGFDSVIITASTDSNQPLELAIDLLRKKGTIVVVGAVPMNFSRNKFYIKELDLKIATSYGPGRYDPFYEELGIDYPMGYVRWSENRNMQTIVELLNKNQLNFKKLTTHKFSIQDAPKAYKLLSGEIKEKYLGILIEYKHRDNKNQKIISRKIDYQPTDKIRIGFIGAGAFAQNNLLPPLKKSNVDFVAISNLSPISSHNVAHRFGFAREYTNGSDVILDNDVNMVFCATRHDSHAKFVIESIKNKKPIFVEKPLCINEDELYEILENYDEHNGRVMVGFNRRFSKPFRKIKEYFDQTKEPMNIIYRVNAGYLPKDHWVQLPEQGGRIIGEVCHFIDVINYLTESTPTSVFAYPASSSKSDYSNFDNVAIVIKYRDGSIGTIVYISMGDNSMPKEYCEVHCENMSASMNNFTEVKFYRGGKLFTHHYNGDKGIQTEISETLEAHKLGKPFPIPFNSIVATTKATFAAVESLKIGEPIELKIGE